MSNAIDPLVFLPEENSVQIFSYLGVQDLARCCQVGKVWKKIASDNELWKSLFPEIAKKVNASQMNVKTYIEVHAVSSRNELLERIRQFAHKVSLNQKGTLTGVLPFNPHSKFVIELTYGEDFQRKPHLQEEFFFRHKTGGGCSSVIFYYTNSFTLKFYSYQIIFPKTQETYIYSSQINKILRNWSASRACEGNDSYRKAPRRFLCYGIAATIAVIAVSYFTQCYQM